MQEPRRGCQGYCRCGFLLFWDGGEWLHLWNPETGKIDGEPKGHSAELVSDITWPKAMNQ